MVFVFRAAVSKFNLINNSFVNNLSVTVDKKK